MGQGEDLIFALKRGQYEGKAAEIMEYLSDIESQPRSTASKQFCTHALSFLYTYTIDFEKLPVSEIPGAIIASQNCGSVIKTYSNTPKDIQNGQKLLYHILNKGLKKEYLKECLGISTVLLELLLLPNQSNEVQESIQTIAHSTYTVLWNAAVREERTPNADLEVCLPLRFIALILLLISNKASEKGRETITWTIDHYSHVLSKKKMSPSNLSNILDLTCKYINELFCITAKRVQETDDDTEKVMFKVLQLDMNIHYISFRLMYDYSLHGGEISKEINRFQGFVSAISPHQKISELMMELMNIGVIVSRLVNATDIGKSATFSLSEFILSMEKAASILLMPSMIKALNLPILHVLHAIFIFCFKLPEDSSITGYKVPKITGQNLSEKGMNGLIALHRCAGKFCSTVVKSAAKLKDNKLVVGFNFVRCKILQYQVTHLFNTLDGPREKSQDEIKEIAVSAQKDLCDLDNVTSGGNYENNPMALDELYSLANTTRKFGRFCVARNMHKEAEWFLKSSLAQFKTWTKHSPDEKLKAVSLQMWKKYELLADSQRKAGLFESALATIAEGIVEEKDHLAGACELWVKVKMEITKQENIPPNTRSLWSYIKEKELKHTADEVLSGEVSMYKKLLSRPRCHELVYVIIEELLNVNKSNPLNHAITLLDKTQVLWLSRKEDEMSPTICSEKAIKLLEGTTVDDKCPAFLDDLKARAHMWHHLVSSIDPIELRDVLTKKSATLEKSEADVVDVEEVQEDNEIYHDCCTIDMDLLSASSADKALEFWEKAVSSLDCKSSIHCLKTTITCLISLTDYYRLTCRVVEEYRSIYVRLKLLSSTDHPSQYLQAQTSLIEVFARLNQPHLAQPVISIMEGWLEEEKDSLKSCQSSTHFVMYLLAKSEIMLLLGKVKESCALIHEAMEVRAEHFKVRSSEALMICSRIYRMSSRIVKLPLSYHQDEHDDCCLAWSEVGSSIELVNHSTKLISGVVCFLMADWLVSRKSVVGKVPPNTTRKWSLLDELLTSLLYTGATYVEFGEALEANCHLQQGLKLSQAFNLPRRFAEFHLELCNLNNLSAKSSESQSHINIASYVLNTMETSQTTSGCFKTPRKPSSTVNDTESAEDGSDSEEMVIKTKPMEMPDMLERAPKAGVIGSPSSKKWKPPVPIVWLHSSSCECKRCSDISVQELLMKQTLQQALSFYEQGLNHQAEASWEMLLNNFDIITAKAQKTFATLLSTQSKHEERERKSNKLLPKKTAKAVRGRKKESFEIFNDEPETFPQVYPVMFQNILVEVSLYLTELSICEQKWELYEQWLDKVEELMNLEKYPWMIENHSYLAKMHYMKMVPALPWPEVVEKTDLEELCERIGGVKMSRQISEPTGLGKQIDESSIKKSSPAPEQDPEAEKPKLKMSRSQSDFTANKPLRPKLSSKATNSRSKKQSVEESTSPPTSKASTLPLQRKRTARKSSEAKPESSKLDAKTPARPSRAQNFRALNSHINNVNSPSSDKCIPEYMSVFKTPVSVSGRRAQLDLLMNSDDDDDLIPLKSTANKKQPSRAKGSALAPKKTGRVTAQKNMHLLSPSSANKMNLNKSEGAEGKFMTPKGKSPISRLMKSSLKRDVIMEVGNENVYDFIPSSPEETPIAARGKKKPGKPGRKPAALKPKRTAKKVVAEDIEVVREKDPSSGSRFSDGIPGRENQENVYIVKGESPLNPKPSGPTSFEKKRSPLTRKLTRARTARLETHRAEGSSSEDSLSLSFDMVQYIPVEEDDFCNSPDRKDFDCHNDSASESLGLNNSFSSNGKEETLPSYLSSTDSNLHARHLEIMSEPIEVPRSDDIPYKSKTDKRVRRRGSTNIETTTEKPRLSRVMTNGGKSQNEIDSREGTDDIVKKTRKMNLSPDLEDHLDKAFSLLKRQPTPVPYRQVCHAKILLELSKAKPDPWTLAYYLTESHSVSFRHTALANIDRKLKTLREETEGEKSDARLQNPHLENMKTTLSFGGDEGDLKQIVRSIENDWTVIQVSVLTAIGEPRGRLIVTRFTSKNDPVVLQLPGFSVAQGQKLMTDFSNILKTNNSTMSLTNKVEWWSQRLSLDEKLKETLENIESRWFGCWVGALQGRLDNDEDEEKLDRASQSLSSYFQQRVSEKINSDLVKLMLQCHHLLDERRVTEILKYVCANDTEEELLAEFLAKTNGVSKTINLAVSTKRRPVILILDRTVQHIPWESMPSLRGQPVSRIPSLHFLCAHLQAQRSDPESVYNVGVDTKKTYYILNPDDNLERTQSTFETRFQSEEGWNGIVGKPPSSSDFTDAITKHDQFIYCGHGSGSKFLSGMTLASLKCHAVAILMGCSSGKLTVDGQLEASGMMLNYFLSGCPSIVACLWDVTDRDIDRYLEELLRRWLQPNEKTSLLDSVHKSMDACRLPYLIGSAPAVYGLPVFSKKQ